ncbi:MAG TPA: NAD(P)H-binding protein [Polyangiaceae bacterium]|nr:NAD(P)H-binding protein [Polyangiaceae bacterium]
MQKPQRVAVLGANGVYARHLIPRLVARGHRVRALVRRPESAGLAIACGAEVRVADIFDERSLRLGLEGCDVAINLATSLPGPSGRGDFESNDHLRRRGTPIWAEACRQARLPRMVQQSIAMVNAAGGDAWSDEDTTASDLGNETAARAIAAALSMEESARDSGIACLVLRGGLFYGPGTGFDDEWFSRARARKLRLPGDGQSFVSLIHIADMADATAAAIDDWPYHETLIISDDQPTRWRDLFGFIARAVGADEPKSGGQLGFPSFRVRNARAREALHWAPRYADYRIGLAR